MQHTSRKSVSRIVKPNKPDYLGWSTDGSQIFFHALDQSLTDIVQQKNNSNQIFGGKVIVFGGDFR